MLLELLFFIVLGWISTFRVWDLWILGGQKFASELQVSAQMLDADDLGQGLSYQLSQYTNFWGYQVPPQQRWVVLVDNGLPTRNQPFLLVYSSQTTNIFPERWWLEDYCPFEMVPFQGQHSLVSRGEILEPPPQQLAWLQDLQLCATCPVFCS